MQAESADISLNVTPFIFYFLSIEDIKDGGNSSGTLLFSDDIREEGHSDIYNMFCRVTGDAFFFYICNVKPFVVVELDESMLDGLGILPQRKQHKKLLLVSCLYLHTS